MERLAQLPDEHAVLEHLGPRPKPLPRPPITKDTTLNALIRQFPQLLHVLHAFRLDSPWWGGETLEEAAWYQGVPVERVLEELDRSITTVRR